MSKTKQIIGVDIGGTKIRAVLWNGKKVLKSRETLTPKNLEDFKSAFLKTITALNSAGKVGIGAAGIINKGKLAKSPNIRYFENFDFSSISPNFKIEKIDNDARCFARSEYAAGKFGKKTALFITLGTGVGRAVGKNGKILNIKKFEYPEEWERQYQKIRDSGNDQKLAEYLGKKITELAKPRNPRAIVVGGGILSRKGFFKKIKKQIHIQVKRSVLGRDAAAIGAAIGLRNF